MGLGKGSCVKAYALENILKTCVIGLVTTFALAFVDGRAGRASRSRAAQPSCSLLQQFRRRQIPRGDFAVMYIQYVVAIHDNNCRQND